MSQHRLWVPNVPSRHGGNQKGQAVRTAGRRNRALAPRADALKGDMSCMSSEELAQAVQSQLSQD